ncbi:hypothetical protein [Halobacterium sp. R2-5]|uniref:hypothetical protein n=1 Tax=Halobacterium sp. R2-5 TaxID=2715751 RepID=UPI00141FE6C2|nr:hypothetical protein [Halobacterium sp. R2-5]NIC01027.1 hypothetical protein [Halobacterium sp. R2-5]
MSGEAKRVHYEVTPTGIEVAVYSDGDIVLRTPDRSSVVLEPAQLRQLSQVLSQLPDSAPQRVSLGENRLEEEARIHWDGSSAEVTDGTSTNISLTIDGVTDVETALGRLGY